MPYDPEKHHRRSIRLPDFDYSQPGAYYITIVTHNRVSRFGDIRGAAMHLNAVGEMIDLTWRQIPETYPGIQIDYYVVMPNHLHGILILGEIESPTAGGPSLIAPDVVVGLDAAQEAHVASSEKKSAVNDIVGRFKSLTTTRYIKGVQEFGWPRFTSHFWQRNFYEHIIRDDQEWGRIAEYITDNPAKWADDPENPDAKPR